MELFLRTSLSFPVVLLSFLLCVAILYWCVAAVGILDVELLDIEMDGDAFQPEGLAGLLLKLGLGGVPVTLVLTLLVFFAWLFCYFVELLMLRFVPLGLLRYPLGALLVLVALWFAVPLTNMLVRPLRPLFRKLEATTSQSLLGQTVVVRSGQVTRSRGEALLDNGGAGLILRVRADEHCGFKRGDHLVLLEHLEAENAYRVITEDEFKGIKPVQSKEMTQ